MGDLSGGTAGDTCSRTVGDLTGGTASDSPGETMGNSSGGTVHVGDSSSRSVRDSPSKTVSELCVKPMGLQRKSASACNFIAWIR